MKRLYPYLMIFSLLLALMGCKKKCHDVTNPDCENYDPCYGQEATSADFMILENMYGTDDYFECDSCIYSELYFRAKHDLDSFQWKVGSDLRVFSGKQLYMEFDTAITKYVDVTLIGHKKNQNPACFPNDDGWDTVTKRVHFLRDSYWELYSEWPVLGKYQGCYDDNPQDKGTISIIKYPSMDQASKYKFPGIIGIKYPIRSSVSKDSVPTLAIGYRTTYYFTVDYSDSHTPYSYLDMDKKTLHLYFRDLNGKQHSFFCKKIK